MMKKIIGFAFMLQGLLLYPSYAQDELYQNCVELGTEEQMEGWEESDRYSVTKGVEKGCKMLLQECRREPDGEMCRAFKKKYLPVPEGDQEKS